MEIIDEIDLLSIQLTQIINYIDENGIERRHLVSKFDNIKIEIYTPEHTPPHFHVNSSNISASFTIDKCEIINGQVDSKTYKKIKLFHDRYKEKLIAVWNRTRPTNCQVGPIK